MSRLQRLLDEIRDLEDRVSEELTREAEKLGYRIQQGRVQFGEEVSKRHRQMAMSLGKYLSTSTWPVILTAPLAYSLLLPLLLLDMFATIYQWICFPIYGIPRVKRKDYFVFDRSRLKYLNAIERIHCAYCSYGNGMLVYTVEIAARTEQYWCPIKHAGRVKAPHSRYYNFLPYGDAEDYENRLAQLRKKYEDV